MNPTQQATAAPVDDAPRVESIGEIVVFVDGYTDPTGIMEFAGVLAQEYDAHLTGVFMRPAPAVTPPEMFVRGTGIPNVIEARQAEVERIEADHRALFDDIVRRNALGSEWRSVPYFSSDGGVHARYADLAVVARPDPEGPTAGPPGRSSCSRHTARHPGSVASWSGGTLGARPPGRWRMPCRCW